MKIWIRATILFLVAALFSGGGIWNRHLQLRSAHLDMREIAFHSARDSIIHTFRLVSQTIAEESLLQDEILKCVHAIVTEEGDLQNYQRGLLYRKLYPMYQRVSQHSIRQLHFHYPDGRSMLRVHMPDRSGDNLTPFRPSVVIANEQNREVHGYESGKMVHGFRHVYPLNYQNIHIGSVEVSNSFQQIRSELFRHNVEGDVDYMFIMLKEDLWQKLVPRREQLYVESALHADYLSENIQSSEYENFGGTAKVSANSTSLLLHLRNHPQLKDGLDSREDFSLVTNWDNQFYAVLFHSITNVVGNHAAYILSIHPEPYLQSLSNSAIRNFVFVLFALALLTFFWAGLKRVKAKQRNTYAFLKTISAKMGEGLYATDNVGKITYVNAETTKLLGYSKKDILNKNAHDLFHIDDSEHQEQGCVILNTIMNNKTYKQKRGFFKSREGHVFPIELTCTPFLNDDQINGSITLFHDITERIEEETERENLGEQLRQKHKMEAVGHMAGGIAHNFNNNLSIILGNVELSQLKQAPNSEVIPLLENAKIAIRRSRDLVQKIIIYSRKGIQNKALIQLPVIVSETVALLQSTLPSSASIEQIIDPECGSVVIDADASQIQEVLVNLCNNAVHAMDEKGVLKILLGSVELTQKEIPAQYERPPGRYAKLSVQDTGSGISTEVLDKIFDPFFTTKEEYEGAGMGLATVQGIVAQHGGLIKVNSVPNQGTVFDLYLPIVDAQITEPTPINTEILRGTEKILLVDDDEMLASLGEEVLTEIGYQVSVMTESTEALKLFTANADSFDLVITDQTMPELTGKDLILELKKIRPDIPTILCTGFSSKIDDMQAAELGINAFLMKPLDLPGLSQAVRRVLDGQRK